MKVKPSTDEDFYEDGEPNGTPRNVRKSGDGTVPWEQSCKLDGVDTPSPTQEGTHAGLIGKYKEEIVSWLNDTASATGKSQKITINDVNQNTSETTASLGISLRGKTAAMLTNNLGLRAGINDDSLTIYKEIPSSSVVRDASGGSIIIDGPETGFYTVTLSGATIGEVFIKVVFMTSETSEEQDFAFYYSGSQTSFTFTYDSTADKKIMVNLNPPIPESLTASFFTNEGNIMTQLNWSAVADPNLAGYRVYSRIDNEPYLTLLTTLAPGTIMYQTNHPWNDPRRIYAVSSFNNLGQERFLSNLVENALHTVANFNANPRSGFAPLKVLFTDTSTGTLTGWEWDFGDGITSTLQNPHHCYEITGTYMVKLKITGVEGTDFKMEPTCITILDPTTTTIPNTTTTTIIVDTDNDGIPDSQDNCPNKPNGPNLGTCSSTSDKPGINCTSDADCVNGCSSNGLCIKDQRDTDNDGVGDVCDNCPSKCNSQQLDADKDGKGDVCDTDPGCGGCGLPQCENQC